jgi:hypothetical protein
VKVDRSLLLLLSINSCPISLQHSSLVAKMVTLFLNVFLGVCVCTGGEFIVNNYFCFEKLKSRRIENDVVEI